MNTTDRFKNIHITFAQSPDLETLELAIQQNQNHTTNTLVLIGLSDEIAKKYNEYHIPGLKYYSINNGMYFLDNKEIYIVSDRFGNTHIIFSQSPTLKTLESSIEQNQTKKAIAFVNLSDEVAKKYNDCHKPELEYYPINDGIWLLRNESTCPKICGGKIYSSSTVILVEYEGAFYGIFIKDFTKPFATLVGGTGDENEYDPVKKIANFPKILERELIEETSGTTKDGTVTGISLLKDTYMPRLLGINEFGTRLFGAQKDIEDINHIYAVLLKDSTFTKMLFDKKNKKNDNYKMNFVGHSEIDYVLAIKLSDIDQFPLGDNNYDNLKTAMENLTKLKKELPISKMAWFYTHSFFAKHEKMNKYTDPAKLKEIGFPPNIKSIELQPTGL